MPAPGTVKVDRYVVATVEHYATDTLVRFTDNHWLMFFRKAQGYWRCVLEGSPYRAGMVTRKDSGYWWTACGQSGWTEDKDAAFKRAATWLRLGKS